MGGMIALSLQPYVGHECARFGSRREWAGALTARSELPDPSMMRRFLLGSLLNALMLFGLPGCGSDSSSSTSKPADGGSDRAVAVQAPRLTTDCDPLVPTYCGFPFPSNVWLVDDPATPTGKHIAFGATTLPHSMCLPVGVAGSS